MNELIYFLIVNAGILAQAIPDFIVWFFFADENPAWKWAKTFRICKWIYDFVIFIPLMLFLVPIDIVVWFYLIKWAHGADSWYNIFSFMFKKPVPNEKRYWRWWCFPYIFKSRILYHEILANWVITIRIIKARVSRNEAWYASLGMEIAFIIYLLIRYWVS